MAQSIHIMHVLSNLGVGGAEIGVLRLIEGLSDGRLRHSITIAGQDRSLIEHRGFAGPCHALGIAGRSYLAFWRMARLFKRHKVDLVHVNNLALWPDAALASRLARCSCIETFHGIENVNLRFSLARRALYRVARLMTDRLTAVSEEAADLAVRLTGIPRRAFQLIPNGVDTERFKPAGSKEEKILLRAAKGLPEESLLLGCVAALRPVKNHRGLLQAFAQVAREIGPSAHLVLVGDGPLREELIRLAAQLGVRDRVLFLGNRTDVAEILRCCDLFILNSHTEGLSYALLEAMSTGLPVIATAVGAAVRLITPGREGDLVPAADTAALADRLKALLLQPESLAAMGMHARRTVQSQYGMHVMLNRYKSLYQELAEKA